MGVLVFFEDGEPRRCEACGVALHPGERDVCEGCESDGRDCRLCQGTGIGQHGPPDTSVCSACHGRGYFAEEDCDGD